MHIRRFDKDGVLLNSKDVANPHVDDFIIATENTGGDTSGINGKMNNTTKSFAIFL